MVATAHDNGKMQIFTVAAIPVLTLVIGAVASYVVATRQSDRDLRTKQRIDYLITAYRTIEGTANRPILTADEKRALERAVADVNLLGSEAQQRAIQRAQEEMASTGKGGFDDVLDLLRQDLRRYLGVEAGLKRVSYFRVDHGTPTGPSRGK